MEDWVSYLVKNESCTHSKVCLDVVNLKESQVAKLRHRTTQSQPAHCSLVVCPVTDRLPPTFSFKSSPCMY